MSLFSEYLKLAPADLGRIDVLRREQLARIAAIMKSDVIAYAVRMTMVPPGIDVTLNNDDVLPFSDLLSGLTGDRVTVVLETPGGSGEVAKRLVEQLHDKYPYVAFLVPGSAMSAGTIMCLGGHDILMGPGSALGPIDAQLRTDGKIFSADAFLQGFERIQDEVAKNGNRLDPTYIPILQRIHVGELQAARNALEFARTTVAEWLPKYKFATWEKDGAPVTDERKSERANEIATELTRQSTWFSHGHSIRIAALRKLGLQVTDFSETPELNDAVLRYQILLRITLTQSPFYKLFDTTTRTIGMRYAVPAVTPDSTPAQAAGIPENTAFVQISLTCNKCHAVSVFQLDFIPGQPLQPGSRRYPDANVTPCPNCGVELNLLPARADIERQVKRPALSPQPTQ